MLWSSKNCSENCVHRKEIRGTLLWWWWSSLCETFINNSVRIHSYVLPNDHLICCWTPMDVTSPTPASLGTELNPASSQGTYLIFPETGIQICLNDVTIDDVIVEEDGTDFIKRQWRRSSWCPLDEKKKEEKHEKQRMILSVAGKRYRPCYRMIIYHNDTIIIQ